MGLQVLLIVLPFGEREGGLQNLFYFDEEFGLYIEAEALIEMVNGIPFVDLSDQLRGGGTAHAVHGLDEVVDFVAVGLYESLQEHLVKRSHVVPADYVVDPLVVYLALLDRLHQLLVYSHVLP